MNQSMFLCHLIIAIKLIANKPIIWLGSRLWTRGGRGGGGSGGGGSGGGGGGELYAM